MSYKVKLLLCVLSNVHIIHGFCYVKIIRIPKNLKESKEKAKFATNCIYRPELLTDAQDNRTPQMTVFLNSRVLT